MAKPWLKNWPDGVPFSIKYPELPLFELLRNSKRKFPNKPAIIFYDKKITYVELNTLAEKFAFALAKLGVKKGDSVALLMPNIPQFIISYYGALRAGAIVVALNPLVNTEEIKRQITGCKAKILVALDVLYKEITPIRKELSLTQVIVTSANSYLPLHLRILYSLKHRNETTAFDSTLNFSGIIEEQALTSIEAQINPKTDLAMIQYTGGTTGLPKGVALTHFNLVANAVQSYQWLKGWGHGDKPQSEALPMVLCAVPFFHTYGITLMNEGILLGSTLILIPKPEPKDILSAIQKYKLNYFSGIPLIFEALLKYSELKDHDLNSLQYCISGGDFLSSNAAKKFAETTGVEILDGYGLTEASPITHCNPIDKDKRRPGSIGIPFPDTEAKIVDIDTGTKDLAPNELGELVIRGPQIMKSYWNMPEEDVYALRNGWLYTGDIAKMDDDGYFYIVDRKKYLIQFSGVNIWARKIEETLLMHPAVKEAAVIGLEDPYQCASAIKAFVILHEEYENKIEAKDLINFSKKNLSDYEVPGIIEFRKELPKTSLGKIDKIALRREKGV